MPVPGVVDLSFVVVMPSFGPMSVGPGFCGFGFVVVFGLAGCWDVGWGFGRVVGAGAAVVGLGLVVVARGARSARVLVVVEGVVAVVVGVERAFAVVVGGRDDEFGGTAGGTTGGAASSSGVNGLSATPLADRTNAGLKPAGQLTTAGVTRFNVTVSAV